MTKIAIMLSLAVALGSPALAQPRPASFAAPVQGVRAEVGRSTVVYVDGQAVRVDDSAVVYPDATIALDTKVDPKNLDVDVMSFSRESGLLFGESVLLKPKEGEPGPVFGIVVPRSGEWWVTITNYQDRTKERMKLIIGEKPGPGPGPEPEPPKPNPSGVRVIVVVEEVADRTPAISDTLSDLRIEIEKGGKHRFVVVDDDIRDRDGNVPAWAKAYIDAAGDVRPCLFIVDEKTAAVIHKGPLPNTADKVLELLK